VVGRLASHLAYILQGKHKPTYDRAKMNGDIVVVSNVEKLMFTGNKMTDKEYIHHTLHPGGLKRIPLPQVPFPPLNSKQTFPDTFALCRCWIATPTEFCRTLCAACSLPTR
jgi:hypothetical protein